RQRLEVEVRNAERAAELWRKEVDANSRLRGKSVVTEIQFLNVQRSFEDAQSALAKSQSMLREADSEKRLIDKRFSTAILQHGRARAEMLEQIEQNLASRQALESELEQRKSELALAEKDAERKLSLAQTRLAHAEEQARVNLRGLDPA